MTQQKGTTLRHLRTFTIVILYKKNTNWHKITAYAQNHGIHGDCDTAFFMQFYRYHRCVQVGIILGSGMSVDLSIWAVILLTINATLITV